MIFATQMILHKVQWLADAYNDENIKQSTIVLAVFCARLGCALFSTIRIIIIYKLYKKIYKQIFKKFKKIVDKARTMW